MISVGKGMGVARTFNLTMNFDIFGMQMFVILYHDIGMNIEFLLNTGILPTPCLKVGFYVCYWTALLTKNGWNVHPSREVMVMMEVHNLRK